jgi:hypothetical protein
VAFGPSGVASEANIDFPGSPIPSYLKRILLNSKTENIKNVSLRHVSRHRDFSITHRNAFNAGMNPDSPPLHRAYIALGSNVGERVEMIEKACKEMERAHIRVKRTSSLFETSPMYVLDQDPFMNGVCEVSSSKHTSWPSVDCLERWKPAWGLSNCWTHCNRSS